MIVDKYLIINARGGVAIREHKPRLAGNEIAVRLHLTIPNALFERPTLEATMKIPDAAVPKATITPSITTNIENIIKEATGLEMSITVKEHEEEK